jgi:eukaryotic-like serine/threonine-protein kinase
MTIKSGTKLGRYEITSLLGAGGMGEVYLAKDPKIGRDVAIKVLPSSISDESRLARFEQEARAAGSLNHPNILAIYDVDTEDGVTYVVSELVTGETLRELMGDEPMPMKKALAYTLQASHGLAAAHEKGIIHRDIKPENLMVTSDGRLKILDFGLAKLIEQTAAEAGTDIPTRKINTDAGTVMGTVGYMSPEQLRGKPVDARSDIFSLGAVVYEMLSGRKAFYKDSSADTISAVLREDPPDLSESNSHVDTGLERVVRRCLEKNREERFHSASDLAFAIEALSGLRSSGQTRAMTAAVDEETTSRRSWTSLLGWALAGLMLLALLAGGWMYYRRPAVQSSVVRFNIAMPGKTTFSESIAISPDGTRVAFSATESTGESFLWVRSLDGIEPQRLAGTDGARFPFWSPDSRIIGYFAAGKLKRVDANGGPSQALADVGAEPRGGSWANDGTILYSPVTTSGLMKIPASGGTPSPVTELKQERTDTSHRWPVWLPDQKHYLFFLRTNDKSKEGVAVGAIDGGEPKVLFNSRIGATYAPDPTGRGNGRLLFVRDGILMAQEFDLSKLAVVGEAAQIAPAVQSFPTEVGPTGNQVVSVSNTGVLVYRPGGDELCELVWVDRNGKASEPVVQPGRYHEPMISLDGRKVVLTVGTDNGGDLWMLDTTRNLLTRFTFDAAAEGSGIFSPDGNTVYFASNRNALRQSIYKKAASGTGSEELVYAGEENIFPTSISPDGRYLLMDQTGTVERGPRILLLELGGSGRAVEAVSSALAAQHSSFSPDGRWIVYSSNESGRTEVYVQPFPTTGGKWQISTNGGDQPLWSFNGKEIFYIGLDKRLMTVPVTVGNSFEVGAGSVLFATRLPASGLTDERNNYVVHPDGNRFLVNNLTDAAAEAPLTVTLNWNALGK